MAQSPYIRRKYPTLKPSLVKTEDLLNADSVRAQLPTLNASYQTDPGLGLWDVWQDPEGTPDLRYYTLVDLDEECEAANPWDALQKGSAVAIDFGTSSTVAAVRESDGNIRLLRIGGDLTTKDSPTQYENPTALEFSDYKAFLKPWKNEPWRPGIERKQVKFSHQAKNELAETPYCGIKNIKTWARDRPGQAPILLEDEQPHTASFELTPLPVEPEDHSIGDIEHRPVDPIELYAYFLGLTLNNQSVFGGRIYCEYTMTFPVKFSVQTKQRILQGFRRGLLRSMPPSLAYSARWQRDCPFKLQETAHEPTAFAAAMLPALNIQPTEEGVAFGVFDFGGGTADFAFGLYRTPTDEEADSEGWERVIDILDTSGDENLGGEHLLDLMAFETIRANMDACRKNEVTFLCPAGYPPFPGSELLFSESREARANTETLRKNLRPLWEEGTLGDDATGQLNLTLKHICENTREDIQLAFTIDTAALRQSMLNRIEQGVIAFFDTFRQAFKNYDKYPKQLHVLLAGNSCRSPLVAEAFQQACKDEDIAQKKPGSIQYHPDIMASGHVQDPAPGESTENGEEDAAQTEAATSANEATPPRPDSLIPILKTGVALGLLNILPGEATGVVTRNRGQDQEAPFQFTVGMFKAEKLVPCLRRNTPYGEWVHLGKVFKSGVTLLGASDSPLAMEEKMEKSHCHSYRLNWGGQNAGRLIYIKAVGPQEIELALWNEKEDAPDETTLQNLTLAS